MVFLFILFTFFQIAAYLKPIDANLAIKLISLVVLATLHGYGAAWLAVRMLFRPRYPVKVLGITIFPQGMIPRHRSRMAKAIGKAVGEELVSQETVLEELFEKEFLQNKIHSVVDSYTNELLTQNYPSLIDSLPDNLKHTVEDSVNTVQLKLGQYIESIIKSEETIESVSGFVERRVDEVLSETFSEAVTDETYQKVLTFLRNRIRSVVHEPALEEKLTKFISNRIDDLANTKTPLKELFTNEAIGILKEKTNEQIGPIVRQLTELATEERTKNQISSLIKKEVHTYYENLPFVKKIFVSRENLLKEVDDLVDDSLPKRIEETLQGDFFAQEAKTFVNKTIDSILLRPLPSLIGSVSDEKLENLKKQASQSLLKILRSEEMQKSINGYLDSYLEKIRPQKIESILHSAHPEAADLIKETLSKGIIKIIQNENTKEIINSVLSKQIDSLVHTPIGKLSNHISEKQIRKTADSLTNTIVEAAKQKLPQVIKDFDIGEVVRNKVDNYPAEKLESLVMSIAKEHLRTIELFGAFLGLVLGLGQAVYFYLAN